MLITEDFRLTKDIVLTAQWEIENKHSAVYKLNGGTYKGSTADISSSIQHGYNASFFKPSRIGYKFMGWKKLGDDQICSEPYVVNENVVFFAEWELIFYILKIYNNNELLTETKFLYETRLNAVLAENNLQSLKLLKLVENAGNNKQKEITSINSNLQLTCDSVLYTTTGTDNTVILKTKGKDFWNKNYLYIIGGSAGCAGMLLLTGILIRVFELNKGSTKKK